MKIIVNTIPLVSKRTGVGNYIFYTMREMLRLFRENQYTFYYGFPSRRLLTFDKPPLVRQLLATIKHIAARTSSTKEFTRSLAARFMPTADLYFEPNFLPLDTIKAKKIVTTVHDFSFQMHPEWSPRARWDHFGAYFWRNSYLSNAIITPTDAIKDEVLDRLDIEAGKVRVIHYGIDHTVFRLRKPGKSSKLPKHFILFVGSIQPRKNLKVLLKAYTMLSEELRKDLKLVLVSHDGWNNEEILESIKKLGKDVYVLDLVESDSELADIYNLATVFAFPSLYEGFGLPPLEAMACGCPVVVSSLASLREVCGDAGYYIDPNDAEEVADGLSRIATDGDLKERLIQEGLKRAGMFSWEQTARMHYEAFGEVLKS